MLREFNKLQIRYLTLRDLVAQLDAEKLNIAGDKGKWSCGQIMMHINMSFAYTISYLNKKIQTPEIIPQAGLKSKLRYLMIKWVLISPVKIKAPGILNNVPELTDMETISMGVNKNLADLQNFIDTYPETLKKKAIFKHPFAGRLNLLQTIKFLDDHLSHHDKQIRQIISKQAKGLV